MYIPQIQPVPFPSNILARVADQFHENKLLKQSQDLTAQATGGGPDADVAYNKLLAINPRTAAAVKTQQDSDKQDFGAVVAHGLYALNKVPEGPEREQLYSHIVQSLKANPKYGKFAAQIQDQYDPQALDQAAITVAAQGGDVGKMMKELLQSQNKLPYDPTDKILNAKQFAQLSPAEQANYLKANPSSGSEATYGIGSAGSRIFNKVSGQWEGEQLPFAPLNVAQGGTVVASGKPILQTGQLNEKAPYGAPADPSVAPVVEPTTGEVINRQPTAATVQTPAQKQQTLSDINKAQAGGTLAGKGEISDVQKQQGGAEQLTNVTDKVKGYYDELKKAGAIVSNEQGPLDNASAYVRSSAAGQLFGKAAGTKEQTIRNNINNARPLVISALRNATGASARAMDSDSELKFYMQAVTNPTNDYESNIEALKNLQNWVVRYRNGQTEANKIDGQQSVPNASAPTRKPLSAFGR